MKANTPMWLVSYRRDEDSPTCTNLVHAWTYDNIEYKYGKCAWHTAQYVKFTWQADEARAKGMPEVWC